MPRTPLLQKVTFSTRLADRLSPRALALLDVLIGMAIFALIAVIAVIAVGQFRHRAYVTGAISDARSVGLAIESAATESGTFPTLLTADGTGDRAIVATVATTQKKLGVITPGNRIAGYAYLPATAEDGSGFRTCVEHVENGAVNDPDAEADAFAVYDSIQAGVIISGSGGCAAAMADLPGGGDDTDDGDDTGDGDGDGDDDGTPPVVPAVDWTGYPDNAGGYGNDTALTCPTLTGVESYWNNVQEQYYLIATFAETDAEYVARTGNRWAEQRIRLIPASTGVPTSTFQNSNSLFLFGGNPSIFSAGPRQKSLSITSGVSEGSVVYVEVQAANWTGGGASPKCQAVGKVTLRKSTNWTTGVVQTLDGSAVQPGFTPHTPAGVPCPQVSNVTYRHTFSYDHIRFRVDGPARPRYEWYWQVPSAGWGNSYLSSWNGVGADTSDPNYLDWPVLDRTWDGGTTKRMNLMVKDTTTGQWSDNCTISVEATKPADVDMSEVIENVPGRVVTVAPYWGGSGY